MSVVQWIHGTETDLRLGPGHRPVYLVRVRIAPNDARNYLVLSSGAATVFEIVGDTDSVSRVIALGASAYGRMPWG